MVARLVCRDPSNRRYVFSFAPAAPNFARIGEARLASYRAPIGRIAALPIGSAFDWPRMGTLDTIEREEFRTRYESGEWDAYDTRVEAEGGIALTAQ